MFVLADDIYECQSYCFLLDQLLFILFNCSCECMRGVCVYSGLMFGIDFSLCIYTALFSCLGESFFLTVCGLNSMEL